MLAFQDAQIPDQDEPLEIRNIPSLKKIKYIGPQLTIINCPNLELLDISANKVIFKNNGSKCVITGNCDELIVHNSIIDIQCRIEDHLFAQNCPGRIRCHNIGHISINDCQDVDINNCTMVQLYNCRNVTAIKSNATQIGGSFDTVLYTDVFQFSAQYGKAKKITISQCQEFFSSKFKIGRLNIKK